MGSAGGALPIPPRVDDSSHITYCTVSESHRSPLPDLVVRLGDVPFVRPSTGLRTRDRDYETKCSSSSPLVMDDVWGNAWAQPEEDVAHSLPSKQKSDDGLSFPSTTASKGDEEADVGLPSWSAGEVNWTEPIGEISLWSSSSVVEDLTHGTDGWGTSSTDKPTFGLGSTYDNQLEINFSSENASERQEGGVHEELEQSRSSTPSSAGTVASVLKAEAIASAGGETASPVPEEPSSFDNPETSDAFGTFEVGAGSDLDEGGITWTSPVAAFDDPVGRDEAWRSAWVTPEANQYDEEAVDEWTVAQREKARRDRFVPPELLAAILDHVNELAGELWPEKGASIFKEDLGNWNDGLASVPGLDALMQRALPEVPGQPPIQFSKSHTAKAMVKNIKLSKNLPVVRNSPMSHLFTAKSLAAWELAVKSRIEVPKDDIPVGWRAAEPNGNRGTTPVPTEKKTSGIFSFFSKRTSAASTEPGNDSKKSSLPREVSSDSAAAPSPSRNSIDANFLSNKMKQSSSVSSFSSTQPPAQPSPTTPTSSEPAAPSDHIQRPSVELENSPAPSAVSRFFSRFTRSRSDTRSSSSSPRHSKALSTDDLEFLSDIVPSHSDGIDHDEQLDSLSAFVSSPAIPAKLPPPLAPPPLAPPPRPTSAGVSRPHPHGQPLLSTPLLPTEHKPVDVIDELKVLSQPPVTRQATPSTVGNGSILPPPLPPPLSPASTASLSKPPTPTPRSGATVSHRRLSSLGPAFTSSRPASVSPPPKTASPIQNVFITRTSSPLSISASASARPSLMTPVSGPNAQGDFQTSFSPLSPAPPPIDKSPDRVFKGPSMKTVVAKFAANLLDDSDEFSDFQSQEAISIRTSQTNHEPGSSFDMGFISSGNSMFRQIDASHDDHFGNFEAFMNPPSAVQSSAIRSLPTPTTPTSLPPTGIPPPLPTKHSPANLNTLHARKPSAADHDATARLMERAAARPGRWPAPPSPLPVPLPPPPSSGAASRTSTSNQSLLELDNDGPAQAPTSYSQPIVLQPIVDFKASPGVPSQAASPRPLLPPSGYSLKQATAVEASLLDLEDFSRPVSQTTDSGTVIPSKTSSSGKARGGLSAQDLSFFEGL